MKALKFLKHMKQTDTPYNFRECKLDEAIAELEALQEENNILKHNYDVQVEYNNTAYKNYTNMVNLLEQEIEAMKPKTCKGCVHEVGDMQDLHCAFCSRSCDDNFEAKDNA